MERVVRRGRERKQSKPERYLCVDEKAFRKGHDYMTIVCDLIGSTVEYVAEERKAESLEGGESEGGQGLGHEGESQRRLEVPQFWLARRFVKRWLVWVNKSDLVPQGGGDNPETSGKHPDLLSPPDYQRRSRGTQQGTVNLSDEVVA